MLTHSLQINVDGRVAAEATGEGWLVARMLQWVIGVDETVSILELKVHTTTTYRASFYHDQIEAIVTRISQSAKELTHDSD